MRYRPLVAALPNVSQLGFGGSGLGGAFGEIDDNDAISAIHAALDHGINYFDVAPYYGAGRAEALLGRALRGRPRDSFVLSTKVGRYGDRDFDFSAPRVRASVEQSLQRLGVERLDVVLAHDVEFTSARQIREQTVPALRALQREGRIGAVGVSALPLAVLEGLLQAVPLDLVLTYAHYHLFDTSAAQLPLGDAALLAAAPLAMGLLSPAGPPSWHPAPPPVRAACARAVAQTTSRGIDIARLALRFALGFDRAASTLIGMRSAAEVAANVHALEGPLDHAALAALEPILAPIRGATWPSGRG